MDTKKVLDIVIREMGAYTQAWRLDWSDFDGRYLSKQMSELADWAKEAEASAEDSDYTGGSDFLSRHIM